jgi:predicted dehydrogenase
MSAPERIRLGVVGAGWAAGLHLEGFRQVPGVELAAITSRTRANAERRAAEYGIGSVLDSLEELLDRVDLVSIASPPAAHHAQVLAVAAAGRHVLCDKPLALDGEQTGQLRDAVAAAGVRGAVGFIWRNDPALLRMRELLAGGAIGALVELHSTCALGVPTLPMTWMYDAEAGGGALAQHGSHVVDRARWLAGGEITAVRGRLVYDLKEAPAPRAFHDVAEAFDWARRQHGTPATGPTGRVTADTGYEFSAAFDTGVRARFWEAWHLPGAVDDEVVAYGESGTLRWAGRQGLSLCRIGRDPEQIAVPGAAASGGSTPREVGLRRWGELAAAVAHAIRTGTDRGVPTLADGHRVAAISDAVRRSDRSGHWEVVK